MAKKTAKIDKARQELLAHVAGSIAAGVIASPSESSATAEAIATISIDIAEEILKKAGL